MSCEAETPPRTPPPTKICGEDDDDSGSVLTPTPPPRRKNSMGVPMPRSTPHVVKLHPPQAREEEEIAGMMLEEERTQRANWDLIEANDWTSMYLDLWNNMVVHDPILEWAQDGAREVITRYEERCSLLLVRECIAHATLARQRYHRRIYDGSLRLESAFLIGRKEMIGAEADSLLVILRWEKTRRPWMSSSSINSPTRKKRLITTTDYCAAPPTAATGYSFKGRQAWLKEKDNQYQRRKQGSRFAVMEDLEGQARGELDGEEAFAFMILQKDQMSERWVAQKKFERRVQDEVHGLKEEDLSGPLVWRRRTDAAKIIQRLGRQYVSKTELGARKEAAADHLALLAFREEASRVIQKCARGYNAKCNMSNKQTNIRQLLDDRAEPYDPSEIIDEAPVSVAAPADEEDENQHSDIDDDDCAQAQRKQEEASAVTMPDQSESGVAAPQNTAVLPWEVTGAQTSFDSLFVLARSLQKVGDAVEKPMLTTLFKAMRYGDFVPLLPNLPLEELQPEELQPSAVAAQETEQEEEEEEDISPEAPAGAGGSYSTSRFDMLDLAFSCFLKEERRREGGEEAARPKAGLVLLADALYRSDQTVAPLAKDGLYPGLEALVLESDWQKTLRDREARRLVTVNHWRPQKLITLQEIGDYWAVKAHHGAINAIELTPTRYVEYVDSNELELEELVEENNREMLRREHIVEEQINSAYSALSIFYRKAGAVAAKEGCYSPFAQAEEKDGHLVAGEPIVGPPSSSSDFQVEGVMCLSSLEFLAFGSVTTTTVSSDKHELKKKHNYFQRYVKTEADDASFVYAEDVQCPDLANVAYVGCFVRYGQDHFVLAAVETTSQAQGTSLMRLNIRTMKVELTTDPLPIQASLCLSQQEPGVVLASSSIFKHSAEVVKVDLATGNTIETFSPLPNAAAEYDEASLNAAALSDGRMFFVKTLPSPSTGLLLDAKGKCLSSSEGFVPSSFMALPSSGAISSGGGGTMLAVHSDTGAVHLAKADRDNVLSYDEEAVVSDMPSPQFAQFPSGKVLIYSAAPGAQKDGKAFAQVHTFGCSSEDHLKPFLNVRVQSVSSTTAAIIATTADEQPATAVDSRDAEKEHEKEAAAQHDDSEVEAAAADDDDATSDLSDLSEY